MMKRKARPGKRTKTGMKFFDDRFFANDVNRSITMLKNGNATRFKMTVMRINSQGDVWKFWKNPAVKKDAMPPNSQAKLNRRAWPFSRSIWSDESAGETSTKPMMKKGISESIPMSRLKLMADVITNNNPQYWAGRDTLLNFFQAGGRKM